MIRRQEKDSCPSDVQEPQRERVSLTEIPLYSTLRVSVWRLTARVDYSAASRNCGAAPITPASTCASNFSKFAANMATRRLAWRS